MESGGRLDLDGEPELESAVRAFGENLDKITVLN